MQYAAHIIKFNPYGCCEPIFFPAYFFVAICYLILFSITRTQAQKLKPKNVETETVEKLLLKKCRSHGLFWMSWAILFLSFSGLFNLIEVTVDYYILAFFMVNLIAIYLLFIDADRIASGVDWKKNRGETKPVAPQIGKGGKSVFKTTFKIIATFFQILPLLTCLIFLIGLNAQPPLEIILFWGMAISLLVAILQTYRDPRPH